jgi:hypothetical protein
VLLFSSESASYQGRRESGEDWGQLRPYECILFG